MSAISTPAVTLCCEKDERRDAVRRMNGRNGLDYVEVSDDGRTLYAFFLGKLPPELSENKPGIEHFLIVEGGERVKDIAITDVDPRVDPDPEKDDYAVIHLDKTGDFSIYTLRLTGVENIDPRYESASFSFKINCPSDLDCAPSCACSEPVLHEPDINYLAKDYATFRQLILDRLALLVPDWKERHVPDIGVALVEVMAYVADYLSYYQDAVATEAYLDTARQRISVRRHVRLIDYHLHQGCNARAWVCLEVSSDLKLDLSRAAFITGLNNALPVRQTILTWDDLRETPSELYLVFEPASKSELQLRQNHNVIRFYTWGRTECCLEQGSTSAALLDAWAGEGRALQLQPGAVLIFEEVLGAKTGIAADADASHRHAVRLTRITPREDPVITTEDGRPTPYVDVEWSPEDALPFPLCLSAIGPAPACLRLTDVSVVRGNVVLVDHGRTVGPEELGTVEAKSSEVVCDCEGQAGEIRITPKPFRPFLKKQPLTWRQPPPIDIAASAAALLRQDARSAAPQVTLTSDPAEPWQDRYDLFDCVSTDRHFVVEIDNDGIARLRFGKGDLGYEPPAGMMMRAVYRIGNGEAGDVGPEAISRLVLRDLSIDGVSVTVRNPMPAVGGTNPESVAEAKLLAPHTFRKKIERAIIGADYEELAERDPRVQQASADLVWTGSWYEADVAIDPLGGTAPSTALMDSIHAKLDRYRRIGHDLHVEPAIYVPLDLELEVCALPYYQRAHVKAALLDVFSNRVLRGGKFGFFHPDNLTFGEALYASRIIAAAQAVPGVECVTIKRFNRLFLPPNGEIESGVLPLRTGEIARLDNDPNHPERGKLVINMQGGR